VEQKTLSIVARAKDEASAELRKVQDAVDKTASQVGGASSGFDKFGSMMDKAGEKMVSAGKTMSIGVTLPIVALGAATINSLMHVEALGAQTDAVLKSTGNAANTTRGQIEDMADGLEKLTGVEAEAVTSGANMLLTFTNIKNGVGAGNDVFNQANKTLLDMATAMNNGVVPSEEAMKAQAIQLGKALNDPIKGVTALSKVGVTFTDQQKEQIKTMVEAGDTMGAQKMILQELNKEFGGSAESFGATTAGKVAKLKNEFGNVAETLMVNVMPAVNSLIATLSSLMEKFQALSPEQQKLIGIGVAAAAAIGPILIIIGKMAQGVQAIIKVVQFLGNSWVMTGIKAVAAGIKTGAVWLANMAKIAAQAVAAGIRIAAQWALTGLTMIGGAIAAGAAYVAAGLAAAAAWIAANAAMLLGIGLIIAAVAGFVILVVKNWDTIKAAAAAVWEWIKNAAVAVFDAIKTAIMFYINIYVTAFQLIWQGAQLVWEGIKIAAEWVFNVIKGVIEFYINSYIAIFNWIKDAAVAVWNAIGDSLKWVWNNIVSPVINFFVNGFNNIWNTVVNVFNSVKNFVTGIFNTIKDSVGNIFGNIGNAITSPFKAAFNAVAGFWNNTIGKLSFKAPDWVPGIGGKGFEMPKLPMLATGGIVTGPTTAIIGEGREPEAVLPLSKLDSMLNNNNSDNQEKPTEIHVHVEVNGTVIGDEAGLAKLAIMIGQKLDQAMKAQNTTNVNMLRVTAP
jgi:phage-related protein